MREAWTDERLDDLNQKVDEGFRRVETDIRDLRGEISARFDSMQRTLILFCGGIIVALIGVIASIVSTGA